MGTKETAAIKSRLAKMNMKEWQKTADQCPGRALPDKTQIKGFTCRLVGGGQCCLDNCVPWHWRHGSI